MQVTFEKNEPGGIIHVTCFDDTTYEFRANPEMGRILELCIEPKRMIIIQEYGVSAFYPALDPARSRVKTLARFPRKIINMNQLKYRLEWQKRRQNYGNAKINR